MNGLLEVTRTLCYQQSDFAFTFILLLSMNHVLTLLYVKHVRDYELDGEMANSSVVLRKHLVLVLWHREFSVLSTQNYLVVCFSSNFLSFRCFINNFLI